MIFFLPLLPICCIPSPRHLTLFHGRFAGSVAWKKERWDNDNETKDLLLLFGSLFLMFCLFMLHSADPYPQSRHTATTMSWRVNSYGRDIKSHLPFVTIFLVGFYGVGKDGFLYQRMDPFFTVVSLHSL